ncbi:MAG: phosphate propanoyltransferase [Eubacteriaceae bacterium]|jgi:putative phosphotransacetylase|nr:phosphate propanoyltransferase [Eubacteriaceae bacterium]MBR0383569.1 phosphate propanoyltransferase [Eubacteriaceae bacterium]
MNKQEKQIIEQIVINTVKKLIEEKDAPNRVPVGISNKHLHLSQEHVDILFGEGHQLTNIKDTKQPGQFACDECVRIIGPKGEFPKVRVLGPVRNETQVELSATDCRTIGIKAPIRESGKLEGTPGCTLIGPEGTVVLDHGVIIALRHIHMTPEIAEQLNLKDGDCVGVETSGDRPLLFRDVLIRVSDKFAYEMHVDTDEANAAGLKNNDLIKVLAKQEK